MDTISKLDSVMLKPARAIHRQGITEKQANFCKFYVDCTQESFQNATISAKLAGFNPLRANEAGCKLLKLQHVQDRIHELEDAIASKIKWDRPKFEGEVVKCYEALPVDNANKFKYLELIGKVMGFLEPNTTNTFIFASMDKTMIFDRVKSITSKLSNINMLDSISSLPNTLHNKSCETLRAENKETVSVDNNQARGSEGIGNEAGCLILSTPPPDISINMTPSLVNNSTNSENETTHSATLQDIGPNKLPVGNSGVETVETKSSEATEYTPTWSGCKHDLKVVDEKWTCQKNCGYVHES